MKGMMQMGRDFFTNKQLESLLTPSIVQSLTAIHKHKGALELRQATNPNAIDALQDVARIQSVESSNCIEGVFTSNARLSKLMRDKTTPRNRSEQEIMGYRDVLSLIHEQHDHIPVTP